MSDTYRALFRWFKEEQININTMAIIGLIILTGFQTYDIWYSQHSLYFDASNDNTITIINGGSELAYITDAYIKIDEKTLRLALPSNDSWVIKPHEKKGCQFTILNL